MYNYYLEQKQAFLASSITIYHSLIKNTLFTKQNTIIYSLFYALHKQKYTKQQYV